MSLKYSLIILVALTLLIVSLGVVQRFQGQEANDGIPPVAEEIASQPSVFIKINSIYSGETPVFEIIAETRGFIAEQASLTIDVDGQFQKRLLLEERDAHDNLCAIVEFSDVENNNSGYMTVEVIFREDEGERSLIESIPFVLQRIENMRANELDIGCGSNVKLIIRDGALEGSGYLMLIADRTVPVEMEAAGEQWTIYDSAFNLIVCDGLFFGHDSPSLIFSCDDIAVNKYFYRDSLRVGKWNGKELDILNSDLNQEEGRISAAMREPGIYLVVGKAVAAEELFECHGMSFDDALRNLGIDGLFPQKESAEIEL